MQNFSRPLRRDDERIELPPGFRFHPTDEELIVCYLSKKVLDSSFTAIAIAEADLNKYEPWDLPWRAKMGEEEWYFFSVRDRKYPIGQRANRATEAGNWKATGKDRDIFSAKTLIGMKKTLVFYKGKAPKGEKTNWVMHEYRLECGGVSNTIQPQNVKNEWVLCRVFQKNNEGRKLNIPPPPHPSSHHHLPPLTDTSPFTTTNTTNSATTNLTEFAVSSHVTCFSDEKQQQDSIIVDVDSSDTTPLIFSSPSSSYQSTPAPPLMVPVPQFLNPQYPDGFISQEQLTIRMMIMMEDYNI